MTTAPSVWDGASALGGGMIITALGAVVLQVADGFGVAPPVPAAGGRCGGNGLRLAALKWQLHLPVYPGRSR